MEYSHGNLNTKNMEISYEHGLLILSYCCIDLVGSCINTFHKM